MSEIGVVVERHLAVEGTEGPVGELHQGIHLHQRRIDVVEQLPQGDEHLGQGLVVRIP